MGFLDKLKDIGFGNTGPRGNQQTGAQNYNSYLRQRTDVLKERGITQALALEAKDGKQISWKKYIELGEKYGVPPEEIAKRGKLINEGNRQEQIKMVMPKWIARVREFKKNNPDKPVSESFLHESYLEVGGLPHNEMDSRMAFEQFMGTTEGKKTFIQHDTSKSLLSIGKQGVKTEIEGVPEDPPEKEEKNRTPVKGAKWVWDWDKQKKEWFQTKIPVAPGGTGGKPSDFERSFQEHKALPGNENVTRAEFKTGPYANITGELSDGAVYRNLQEQSLMMDNSDTVYADFIKEYNAYRRQKMSRADAMEKVLGKDRSIQALMPPAAKHKGRVIVDGKTEKRYKSDGTTWVEIKKKK